MMVLVRVGFMLQADRSCQHEHLQPKYLISTASESKFRRILLHFLSQ
jgi:hypothetical protein